MAHKYGILLLCLSAYICGSYSLTLEKGSYEVLNGLCGKNEYFGEVPWDCTAYVQCVPGNLHQTSLLNCPAGLHFDTKVKTCTWDMPRKKCPSLKETIDGYCVDHPGAILPNPEHCAQYYQCSGTNAIFPGQSKHLRECGNSELFDLVTATCKPYNQVECTTRKQPISPCDYIANREIGGTGSCTQAIPGCEGKADGPNPYPSRLLSPYYLRCAGGVATSVETCVQGLYDPIQNLCTENLDPQAIERYCLENPKGRVANPGNCAMFYDCTRTTPRRNFQKYEEECSYPKYFVVGKGNCNDFWKVQCGARKQPVSRCEYQRYACRGPQCPVCDGLYPSCVSLQDGRHPYPGRENTESFIECFKGRTVDMNSRCPNGGIFDAKARTCRDGLDPDIIRPPTTDPMPPIDGGRPERPRGRDCIRDPHALIPDATNCARYINCSKVSGLRRYSSIVDECNYPELFSARKGACDNFIEVDCQNRYIPKSPCEYQNTRNMCNGPMCKLPCEERSPSCVGKPNGNNTFPERELTSFYVSCLLERTLSVGICHFGVYDPVMRYCTTELDPLSVKSFCQRHPNTVFPHVANCAKYYNCSDARNDEIFGPYLRECSYPTLFNIAKLDCVNPQKANCRWRAQPRNPCDYRVNQYCPDPTGCVPCSERFPTCAGKPNGRNAIKDSKSRYFVCEKGKFVSMGECTGRLGAYDPVTKTCVAPYSCRGLTDGKHAVAESKTGFFICANGQYISEDSCAPDTFDPTDRACVQSPCVTLLDGLYPIPEQTTDYFQCQGGRFVKRESCFPYKFDSNKQRCRTNPDCTNKHGNYPLIGSPTEFFICRNGEFVSKERCDPQEYNVELRRCNVPSCKGLPDGNNALIGSENEFIICRHSYYIRTASCSPSTFDHYTRQCASLDCNVLQTGTYPIPGTDTSYIGADTDWIRCQDGKRVDGGSCNALSYDPMIESCQEMPSCLGKPDGSHGVEGMPYAYIVCGSGVLFRVISCAPFKYDPILERCSFPVCEEDGKVAIPWDNRLYIQCRGSVVELEGDCGNSLFNPMTGSCYESPSCHGFADGKFPFAESKYMFYECVRNKFYKLYSCAPLVFNNGKCIHPVNPSDPSLFCQRNPSAIFPHPNSCARYIDCSNPSSILGPFQAECPYPNYLDKTDGSCKFHREVQCGDVPQPKSPCEYEMVVKSRCPDPNAPCTPCEEEHPSCVGKPDGPHSVPNRPEFFVQCMDERTVNVQPCPPSAPYFDPIIGTCSVVLDPLNPRPYCKANPTVVAPHPHNCAQFIDCRQRLTSFGLYRQECPYKQLFDEAAKKCRPFRLVKCGKRPEPVAPCEYETIQQCIGTNEDCTIPCIERYPSCVGLPDGNNPFPGQKDRYIVCSGDRTLSRELCGVGTYDKDIKTCIVKFDPANPRPYCKANPRAKKPNEFLCSQYYDCSKPKSSYGRYLHECPYPLLFSLRVKSCQDFATVNCTGRFMPITPCEYLQNKCAKGRGGPDCEPCEQRLPSCLGLPNGNNTFPGKEDSPYFITCFNNRTIFVRTCDVGYFNPIRKECQIDIDPQNPEPYCNFNKNAKVAHPGNCAKYYDCSRRRSKYGKYVKECKYPMLFSRVTSNCEDFTSVDCDTRPIKRAPCEYDQNTCAIMGGGPACIPCKDRLPSCIGKIAGNYSFPGRELSQYYVVCLRDRTLAVRSCDLGYFDPATSRCTSVLTPDAIQSFCAAHQGVIKENPINCAQYFDCGRESLRARTFLRECPYPMQFSIKVKVCRDFSKVKCGMRRNVKTPCEYLQNRCDQSEPDCIPCEERIPSCKGLRDGDHPYPGKPMNDTYIVCYKGRTMSMKKCRQGLFDPASQKCTKDVTDEMIRAYCAYNPTAIIPHPFQCAQYYDCRQAIGGSHLRECRYPQLFSAGYVTCRNFSEVDCGKKFEPQAPCDYLQNRCPPNVKNCRPCKRRLPSCVNLPDGSNTFPGRPRSEFYVRCYRNRTVSVEACRVSRYDNKLKGCSLRINRRMLRKYCTAKPDAIIPDPSNCARFFNCSERFSKRGLKMPYLNECHYPKLFGSPSIGCQSFSAVNCLTRYEPKAPCEYNEYCKGGLCKGCAAKFPSCIGKIDGTNTFPGQINTPLYTVCFYNRTVAIMSCTEGYYDKDARYCVKGVPPATAAVP